MLKYISRFMFTIGLFLIVFGFIQNKQVIYSYNTFKKSNYDILLKPNVFYEKKSTYYPSSAVKQINIDFIYKFKGNKNTYTNYKYDIKANLIGTFDEDKEVLNKCFVLKNKTLKTKNNFNIFENVNIDYNYYYNLVRAYEETYGILINANLKIKLNVSYNLNLKKPQKVTDSIELTIPITDTITYVSENYKHGDKKVIKTKKENKYYIFGISICLFSLITMLYKSSAFDDRKQIFKDYHTLIVKVKNKPDLTGLKVMLLDDSKDLIDLALTNHTNIIYFNNKFYVITNIYVYIYTL